MRVLETDHRTAESLHASSDALIRRWIKHGSLSIEDAAALSGDLDQLAEIYGRHIEIEDTQVFPAAARALSPSDIEEIGREMAARRNVPYLPPVDVR
jgi:hemerythrin-like domain-containing protein